MPAVSKVTAQRAHMKGVYADPLEPGRRLVRKNEGVSSSGLVAFTVQDQPNVTVNLPKGERLDKVNMLA